MSRLSPTFTSWLRSGSKRIGSLAERKISCNSFRVIPFFFLSFAMIGCLSDEERYDILLDATRASRLMVETGDTLGALGFLEDKLNRLPNPKNAADSALYGWMYARYDFLCFHVYDSKSITANYYQASYPYLKYIPETTRIDVLRWTARTLLLQGDTLSALPYLYESRHRALAIGDSVRVAKADTCLSYLRPKELLVKHQPSTYNLSYFLNLIFITILYLGGKRLFRIFKIRNRGPKYYKI